MSEQQTMMCQHQSRCSAKVGRCTAHRARAQRQRLCVKWKELEALPRAGGRSGAARMFGVRYCQSVSACVREWVVCSKRKAIGSIHCLWRAAAEQGMRAGEAEV